MFKFNFKEITKGLPEVAGIVGGTIVANKLSQYTGSLDAKIVSGLKIFGGLALKGNKSALVKGAAYGMIAQGANELYDELTIGMNASTAGIPQNVKNAVGGAK